MIEPDRVLVCSRYAHISVCSAVSKLVGKSNVTAGRFAASVPSRTFSYHYRHDLIGIYAVADGELNGVEVEFAGG